MLCSWLPALLWLLHNTLVKHTNAKLLITWLKRQHARGDLFILSPVMLHHVMLLTHGNPTTGQHFFNAYWAQCTALSPKPQSNMNTCKHRARIEKHSTWCGCICRAFRRGYVTLGWCHKICKEHIERWRHQVERITTLHYCFPQDISSAVRRALIIEAGSIPTFRV